MTERRRKSGDAVPSKDTAPEALPVVDGQPGPGSRSFGMPDEDVGAPPVWAYWQPLPHAFWGADVPIQQEIIHSALQQAWPLLQQRTAAAGLTITGTPRVRISIEVDTTTEGTA